MQTSHPLSRVLLTLPALLLAALVSGAVDDPAGAKTIRLSSTRAFSLAAKLDMPESRPAYAIRRVTTGPAIVIDGKFDDPAWQGIPAMSDFLVEGKALARNATIARLVRDDTYLYLAMDCRQPNIRPVPAQRAAARDTVAWGGEVVELFLNVGPQTGMAPQSRRYVQVIFDTSGAFTDMFDNKPEWNGDIVAATQVLPESGWRLEARLKIADLGGGGRGEPFLWSGNVCRSSGGQDSNWAGLVGSHHQPDRFGLLTLASQVEVTELGLSTLG